MHISLEIEEQVTEVTHALDTIIGVGNLSPPGGVPRRLSLSCLEVAFMHFLSLQKQAHGSSRQGLEKNENSKGTCEFLYSSGLDKGF